MWMEGAPLRRTYTARRIRSGSRSIAVVGVVVVVVIVVIVVCRRDKRGERETEEECRFLLI